MRYLFICVIFALTCLPGCLGGDGSNGGSPVAASADGGPDSANNPFSNFNDNQGGSSSSGSGSGSGSGGSGSGSGGGSGSGSSGSPSHDETPEFASSVDPERLISDLTEEEIETICDELDAFTQAHFRAEHACLLMGIVLSESPEACDSFIEACTAEVHPPDGDECRLINTESCDEPLGRFEACRNESEAYVRDMIAHLSCADAGNPPVTDQLGPVCESLQEACPEMVDGE